MQNTDFNSKRIAIYLYDIRNRNVGIGEFSYHLGRSISEKAPELKAKYGITFCFIVPHNYIGEFGDSVSYVAFSPIIRFILKFFSKKTAIYHAVQQGARLKNMHRADINLMTIHDINFMYEKHGLKQIKYSIKLKKRLKRASHLSYISNFAKNDVDRVFTPNHPATIIYNGVNDLTDVCCDMSRVKLPERFLFHISSLLPKKNVHLLVEMMKYLPQENLVIAGNMDSDYVRDMEQQISELGLTNVSFIGKVSNEEKAELYRRCTAFLFPSLCEGFGLPPIEAMYFGKPSFLSTLTSLPEIGGDCAYYFDDLEPEKMAEVITARLTEFEADKSRKESLIKQRAEIFSWEKSSDEYINLYLKLLGLEK